MWQSSGNHTLAAQGIILKIKKVGLQSKARLEGQAVIAGSCLEIVYKLAITWG